VTVFSPGLVADAANVNDKARYLVVTASFPIRYVRVVEWEWAPVATLLWCLRIYEVPSQVGKSDGGELALMKVRKREVLSSPAQAGRRNLSFLHHNHEQSLHLRLFTSSTLSYLGVAIATVTGSTGGVRSSKVQHFCLLRAAHTDSEVHPASYLTGTSGSFPGKAVEV
jgi:hypothetical protein